MFTAAAVTAALSYLGGDLLALALGKLGLGAAAGPAAKALVRVVKVIEANGQHLPPGVMRQIRDEAMAAGHVSRVSMQESWVPRTGGGGG